MYGSLEFEAAYAGFRAGAKGRSPSSAKRQASGETVKWLIDLYRASPAWAVLKPATRKGRETVLDHLMATVGDRLIDDLTREEIERRTWRRKNGEHGEPDDQHAAHHVHLGDRGEARRREPRRRRPLPQEGSGQTSTPRSGIKTWTEDDLTRYEAAYPVGTLQIHVYDWFCLGSSRRRYVAACWQSARRQKKTGRIQIRTEKTGKAVYPPPLQRGL